MSEPRWVVREAGATDWEALRTSMTAILQETAGQKTAGFGPALWEWQYLRPELPSLIVVADDGGTIVGYCHVLILPLRYRGRIRTAAMVQDVATLPAYRGQGMFRSLGGFALERMLSRGVDFIYTFPNARSLPSFVRDHAYTIAGRVPVYVAPLDVSRLLGERLRPAVVGRALGAVAGPLWRALRVRRGGLAAGETVVPLAAFDAKVEIVAREFAERVTVGLARTTRCLTWRFLEKPTREYALWGLEREGQLVAYVVTRITTMFSTTCLLLMDLGCRTGADEALLRLVTARLDAERAAGASLAVALGLHPAFAWLASVGFVRVPERVNPRPFNLVIKALAEDVGDDLGDPGGWLITLADWDVF
jgi:GNAT superfamily N-acetyltransferase